MVIDNGVVTIYERDIGHIEGFNFCKAELMDVIEYLANQVAVYRYPNQYAYSDEQLDSIMLEAGLSEEYIHEI